MKVQYSKLYLLLYIYPGLVMSAGAIVSHSQPNSLLSLASALGTVSSPPGLGITPNSALSGWSAASLAQGLAQAPVLAQDAPQWIYLTRRFKAFLNNLELTPGQIEDGLTKAHRVVACLNAAYYGTNSSTDHAFLIGSWAKGTKVRPPRDVDLYFVLPVQVYHRFEQYSSAVNKQSALLQEVKSKLLATYHSSDIRGDGPVVLAGFRTYDVEIVPAFVGTAARSYYVCDTKNGGSYKKTMPLHEVDNINAADSRNSNNVRPLVRMLKAWQSSCSVPIASFHLELLAAEFLDQCEWRDKDYFYYDWISRDFFKWLTTKANTYLFAPGTYQLLWLGDAWKSRAESAYTRALKACEYEKLNDMANAGDEWQKIYGNDIPKWV